VDHKLTNAATPQQPNRPNGAPVPGSPSGESTESNDTTRGEARRRWSGIQDLVLLGLSVAAAVAGAVALFSDTTSKDEPQTAPSFWVSTLVFLVAMVVSGAIVAAAARRSANRLRQNRIDLMTRLFSRYVDDGVFSKQARSTYLSTVERFAFELAELGVRAAKREGVEGVSERHITRSSELLSMGTVTRRGRHLGALGGVLLGMGLSVMADILIDKKLGVVPVLISFVAALIGLALLAYNWAKD
jgi:hypothetical protein